MHRGLHQHLLFPHQLIYAEAVTSFQLWKPSAHLARQQQLLQVVRDLLVVAHVDHLLVCNVVAGAMQAPRRARWLVAGRRLQSLGELQKLLWLYVCVRQQMGLQVGSLVETSLTNWATVRRLFVVENFMNWE